MSNTTALETVGKFATRTTVAVEKTQDDIRKLLKRYNADAFGLAEDDGQHAASIQFRIVGRNPTDVPRWYRFMVRLPTLDDVRRFRGEQEYSIKRNKPSQADMNAYAQVARSRWRALLLVIKAQLEAVEIGIMTLEQAFAAQTVLPNGRTAGEEYEPAIRHAYLTGQVLRELPMLPAPREEA